MCKAVCSILVLLLFVLPWCSGNAFGGATAAIPGSHRPYLSYLTLKGGAFFPQGTFKRAESGFNGEIAYGVQFSRWIALELGSGYFEMRDTGRVSFGSNFTLKGSMYAIPLTLTVKGILPLGPLDVYGLAGGGGYYVHAKGAVRTSFGSTTGSIDTGLAGGFLGAGVAYNFTSRFFLGLEAKYLWTESASFTIQGERVESLKVEGVQGTAILGFRF
jgi:opacity protein-like surface antigen